MNSCKENITNLVTYKYHCLLFSGICEVVRTCLYSLITCVIFTNCMAGFESILRREIACQ